MKLFAKSKPGAPSAAGATPRFQPVDRVNLLGLLDRIVNQGEACVVRLRESRGAWTYAFQGGGLTHASGGSVGGARQAFDLLWEFQQGEVSLTAGVDPTLSSNLYIDKARLLDLIRRSQAALHAPGSPYIPPDQQRPVPPVNQPWPPPGQRPATPPPGWNPAPYPQAYPGAAPPPGYPAAGPQPYPGYPAPYSAPAAYPAQPGPQPAGPQPQPPQPWPGYPAQAPPSAQPMAPPPRPMTPPAPPRPPARPATPPSFSVPPMPLPKPRGTVNLPGRSAPPPAVVPPAAPAASAPVTPVDELKTLRASLVSQAPAVPAPGAAPNWNVRGPGGAVAPPAAPVKGKGAKGAKGVKAPRRPGPLRSWGRVKLITFLLWACERKYSPDDHWTVKDAFEVATLELRDQFLGAFSQSFQSAKPTRPAGNEFEGDQIASGRTRGRTRGRRR